MDVQDLGIASYEDALEHQHLLLEKRIKGEVPDTLIMVEHPPVVTLGRTSQTSSILNRDFFDVRAIPVVETRRGGKITYHAPGQLVIYPIIDLREKRRDVSFFIDFLERVVVESLNTLGIPAANFPEKRGVWLGDKKIAFIGIAVKRWVTYHGVAININNDVTPFSYMNPCGEKNIRVTSAKEHLNGSLDMKQVKKVFAGYFKKGLKREYLEEPVLI